MNRDDVGAVGELPVRNKDEWPLLSARGLKKTFKTAAGPLTVLDGADLDIPSGAICYIVGRSGSGKSTLLYLLSGLDRPDVGSVEHRGQNIHKLSDREVSRFRNRHLGFVFQFYHLLPELTLMENLLLPCWMNGTSSHEGEKRARMLLEEMELTARDLHFPSQLSGGEQQRVAIARALMNGPDVVLCDEPTGNLDRESARKTMDVIDRLNKHLGQTFCIVTHEEAIIKDASHIFRLDGGKLHCV